MTDRPISNKENLLRTIRHESPEWLPMRSDFVNFTPSIIPDNVARHYVLEAKPWEGPEDGLDAFGIKWKYTPPPEAPWWSRAIHSSRTSRTGRRR